MSIFNRVISLLLCIIMMASVLASCNNGDTHINESGQSDASSPKENTNGDQSHTHTPATAVTENVVDSTCTQRGSYDEVVYCSKCQKEISRTQKEVNKKSHDHSQKVTTTKYLKAEATCTDSAVYYYSCSCGDKGTASFRSGDPLDHNYNQKVVAEKYLKAEATCTDSTVYYYSCVCGVKGNTTFTNGEANGHSYSSAWEKSEDYHWHKATCEHTTEKSGEAKHNYGSDNVCDTCGYDKTISVSGVTLNFSSLILTINDVKDLVATITPENASDCNLVWTTSDSSVVTVDKNGKITAVGSGMAIITVTTENGKNATCEVTVNIPVEKITLDRSSVSMEKGQTITIYASVSPSNATDNSIIWTSSDPSVVSVDSNGKIKAISNGVVVIMATTTNGLSSSCTVTVTEAEIVATNINLSQDTASMLLGDTLILNATITPNNVTNKSVIWSSSDNSVATVHNGTVVAVAAGTVTITATTSNGKSASCVITVLGRASGISLNNSAVELDEGDSVTLIAAVEGNSSAKILWSSSDVSVATVSSNGKVQAVAPGYTIITALINGTEYHATCYIFVNGDIGGGTEDNLSDWQKDSKLKNLPEPDFGTCTNVTSGGATFIEVTREEAMSYLNKLQAMGYSFSSTANTSYVYAGKGSNGVYTVNIGWTLNGNNFSVLVQGGPSGGGSGGYDNDDDEVITPTSISLNQSTVSLTKGNSAVLVATVFPANAENKAVSWTSSNTNVVTVINGIVTAVGKGTATITVRTINGKSATCTVTVTTPVTQIVLDRTNVVIEKNETLTLSAGIFPTDAVDATLSWTSSNSAIVTVENGVLRAVGKGTATITVRTANGVSATCNVLVTVPASSVSLNTETKNMVVGDTAKLVATVYPEDANNKSVTWKSSDPSVVSVDNNGNLSAISTGTAIITATSANNVVASCAVTVSNIAINLDKTSLEMIVGETETLIATITPNTAMNQNIIWTSSDPSVVTVTNGVLTAIKNGTVTITARSEAGESIASCRVTVLSYKSSFGTLQQNGNDLYTVVSNSTTSFSFKNEITLEGKAIFVVSSDEYGENTIITKTVSLKEGDNTYYIHIASDDDVVTYKVTIRRRPMYNVTFKHENRTVDIIVKVEEGAQVNAPQNLIYLGYIVESWDHDITQPIITNMIITAVSWRVSDEMADFDFVTNENECIITAVKDNSKTEYIIPNFVTKIGEEVFKECVNLKSIEIPDSVKTIDTMAFAYCSSLESVTLGNCLETLGAGAFSYTSIKEIIIPRGVKKIDLSTFEGCIKLETVILPESLTMIESGAFNGCQSLKSIIIPEGVVGIGDYAFALCKGLVNITIPNSVTSIGNSAFYGCTSITSMIMPFAGATLDGTKNTHLGYIFGASSIYDNDTYVPESLKTIIITGGTSIGNYAFMDCTDLTSITIPDSITSIGNYAFYRCSGLTSITIPDSITSIGNYAFYCCSGLTSIIIPEGVTSIGDGAFSDCTGLTSITIPFVGAELNGTRDTHFGYIFGAFSETDHDTDVPESLKTVIITGGTSIDNYAFEYCIGITSITIPDSITSIGQYAFDGCTELTSITIPNSVISVGIGAFNGCEKLESITVEEGNQKYHSAGNCLIETSTKILVAGCKSSIIPTDGSVTSIGEFAFSGRAGHTSIIIPESIKSFESFSFSSTELEKIYYEGTSSGWTSIKGSSFTLVGLQSVKLYYYSKTEPTDTNRKYWHYVDGVPTPW